MWLSFQGRTEGSTEFGWTGIKDVAGSTLAQERKPFVVSFADVATRLARSNASQGVWERNYRAVIFTNLWRCNLTIACSFCEGTGSRDCSECEGKGICYGPRMEWNFESAGYCSNRHPWRRTPGPRMGFGLNQCGQCHGSGKRSCLHCYGSGSREV